MVDRQRSRVTNEQQMLMRRNRSICVCMDEKRKCTWHGKIFKLQFVSLEEQWLILFCLVFWFDSHHWWKSETICRDHRTGQTFDGEEENWFGRELVLAFIGLHIERNSTVSFLYLFLLTFWQNVSWHRMYTDGRRNRQFTHIAATIGQCVFANKVPFLS